MLSWRDAAHVCKIASRKKNMLYDSVRVQKVGIGMKPDLEGESAKKLRVDLEFWLAAG